MSIVRKRIRRGWRLYIRYLPLLARLIRLLPIARARKGILIHSALERALEVEP